MIVCLLDFGISIRVYVLYFFFSFSCLFQFRTLLFFFFHSFVLIFVYFEKKLNIAIHDFFLAFIFLGSVL